MCIDNWTHLIRYKTFERKTGVFYFFISKEKAPQCGTNSNEFYIIVYYLENLDPYYGDIKKYFISIPRDECEAKIVTFLK